MLTTALERRVYLPTVLSEWENIASVFYAGHAILILMPRGENLILKAQIVNNVTQSHRIYLFLSPADGNDKHFSLASRGVAAEKVAA